MVAAALSGFCLAIGFILGSYSQFKSSCAKCVERRVSRIIGEPL